MKMEVLFTNVTHTDLHQPLILSDKSVSEICLLMNKTKAHHHSGLASARNGTGRTDLWLSS